MKRIAMLSLCVVLLFALAFSASAAVVVTKSYNADNPTFGSDSQMASNPEDADDEDDYNIHVSTSVPVNNNGTSAVTITSIDVIPRTTSRGKTFGTNELNITLAEAVSLGAGSSSSLGLSARIPEGLDAVDMDLEEAAFYVADIKLKDGSGTELGSFPVYMQRENHLLFDKVYIKVMDDSSGVDDGDDITEVKPGDHVEVEGTIENTYDEDDGDLDIKKTKFYVEIDDRDLDVDEDPSLGTLDAGDSETEIVEFDVDEDVPDDGYDLSIRVDGKDQHGAWHGEAMEINFEVEKNKHEIKIDSISVTPDAVDCGESVSARVEISNIGRSDEDEVVIRVYNNELKIDSMMTKIDLEEGDSTIKTFDIHIPTNVSGKEISTGTKPFTVIAYYDFQEETDRDVFDVDVESCAVVIADDVEEEEEEDEVVEDDLTSGTTTQGTTTAETVSDSTSGPKPVTTTVSTSDGGFRSSAAYVVILVFALIVIVVAIAAVIAKVLIARR